MIGEKKLILAHSFRERSIYLDLQRDLLRAYLQLGRRRGLDRDSLAHLGRAPRRRPPTRARTSASSFTLAYSEIFLELRFLKPLLAGSLLVYGYPTFELLLGERRRLLLVYGRSFERSTAHTGPRPNFHQSRFLWSVSWQSSLGFSRYQPRLRHRGLPSGFAPRPQPRAWP